MKIFCLLVSGNTQARTAKLLRCSPTTVARKLLWLARFHNFPNSKASPHIQIDEMESIEHTKLKPLTIPLCVDAEYRILGITVGKIPAKGPHAELARKKYGVRPNERESSLRELLEKLKNDVQPISVTTDAHPLYPKLLKEYFPNAQHIVMNSRAQKEKKRELIHNKINKKVFDPMFALNQRCAKIRSDVRRMTRRSWCTTKKIENLKKHLELYKTYNNSLIKI
jgi:IS1 family transposase